MPDLVPSSYRPNTIRRIIIALMDEFRGFNVEVFEKGGGTSEIKEVRVPVAWGHLNKYHQIIKRKEDQPTTDDPQYYEPLPKIALGWDSIVFNGERAKSLEVARHFSDPALGLIDVEQFTKDVSPVPYDLGFTMEIRTQSMGHFTQLLENILPYFTPSRYLRVKEFSFLNIERNLKVRLDGVSQDFLSEQTEENVRYVRGILQLTVEAFMYRPLTNERIIKEIRSRYIQGPQSSSLSAMSSFNTSGWNSSAVFPGIATSSFDFSGSFSGTSQEFDWYVDQLLP